jgi:hypothetical protein
METSCLQFYWYEIKPHETRGARWGQLAGAMHRLRFVCDEIEAALATKNVSLMIKRLEYHADNYVTRAYELRERLVKLLIALGLDSDTAGQLKAHGSRREEALQRLRVFDAQVAAAVTSLLEALGHDLSERNRHTHDTFLSLGVVIDGQPFDPDDVLLELSEELRDKEALHRVLRVEGQRLAGEYGQRGSEVVQATMAVLEAANGIRGV